MNHMQRTVFSNVAEAKAVKLRTYYGVIDYEKAPSQLVVYETNIRSEAVTLFEEEARLNGGTLKTVSTFK